MSYDDEVRSHLTRADFLKALRSVGIGAAALAGGLGTNMGSGSAAMAMKTRPIPSTGERIAIVGLGTYKSFNTGPSAAERAPHKKVLQILFEQGSTLIDTAPMYKPAETVIGDLLRELGLTQKAFVATKVRTAGKENGLASYDMSEKLLGKGSIDLMQVHSLKDWKTQLPMIRDMKAAGRWRYIGITHSNTKKHDNVIKVMGKEKLDFIQINYSLLERNAEKRILPMAADKGMAVLINKPFVKAKMFKKVKGQKLPEWAKEFDCTSWGQFFLKFILSHPAVTAAISATRTPKYMIDNAAAGRGRMPDAKERQKMIQLWESL